MMRRHLSIPLLLLVLPLATSPLLASAEAAFTQAQAAPQQPTTAAATGDTVKGGTIHGSVKAGTIPLPGVSITATNTLTGKKYFTATDAHGDYTMTIPQNGRYVLRTDLAAFAASTQEALLNAASHDQKADFTLTLASRAVQQEGQENQTATASTRQYSGRGAQNLSLAGVASDLIAAASSSAATSGAALPSLASNPDVSGDSVAVAGQNGSTNPFAGFNPGEGPPLGVDIDGGGGFGGGGGGFGGGRGGRGGGGFGGGGGGRGNFRNFNPNQPHGAIFWTGGNSALNADPFSLRGQQAEQPSSATNKFGATFLGAPYIPHLIEHDTRDFLFFTLSGQRSSSPTDQYGTVPSVAERAGNFQGLTTQNGTPITIYDPNTQKPYAQNTIPGSEITSQATALLSFVPLPTSPASSRITAA